MTENMTLTIAALEERVEHIFVGAGLSAIQAGALAKVIVAAERDGCKSSGIHRIEGALRTVKARKVKSDALPELVAQDAVSIIRVNADGPGPRLPSQRRFSARTASERDGVTLTGADITQLNHFQALGLDAVI